MTQTATKAVITPLMKMGLQVGGKIGIGAIKKEASEDELCASVRGYFDQADVLMFHFERLWADKRLHKELFRTACRLHAKREQHEREWIAYKSKLAAVPHSPPGAKGSGGTADGGAQAFSSRKSARSLFHNARRGFIFTKEVAVDLVEEITGLELDEDWEKVVPRYLAKWERVTLLANSLSQHSALPVSYTHLTLPTKA